MQDNSSNGKGADYLKGFTLHLGRRVRGVITGYGPVCYDPRVRRERLERLSVVRAVGTLTA